MAMVRHREGRAVGKEGGEREFRLYQEFRESWVQLPHFKSERTEVQRHTAAS